MAHSRATRVLAALSVVTALTAVGCTSPDAPSHSAPAGHSRPDDATTPQQRPPSEQSASGTPAAQETPRPATAAPETSVPPRTAPARGSTTATPRTAWCTTEALSPELRPGEPGAGNRYAALVFTNISDAPCRTQGWPGLQLTGGNGQKIPTHTVRDTTQPARPLTIPHGGQVWSRLHWTVVPSQGDPSDGSCPAPSSLRVIPPDQRAADSLAWQLGTVCGAGRLRTLPLRTGSGPER